MGPVAGQSRRPSMTKPTRVRRKRRRRLGGHATPDASAGHDFTEVDPEKTTLRRGNPRASRNRLVLSKTKASSTKTNTHGEHRCLDCLCPSNAQNTTGAFLVICSKQKHPRDIREIFSNKARRPECRMLPRQNTMEIRVLTLLALTADLPTNSIHQGPNPNEE